MLEGLFLASTLDYPARKRFGKPVFLKNYLHWMRLITPCELVLDSTELVLDSTELVLS